MTYDEFVDFSDQMKQELQRLYNQKALGSLIQLIDKKFRQAKALDNVFELHIYGQLVGKDDTRRMIPLCFIGPSQTREGKYVGVHFGTVPKLSSKTELRLEVIKK